MSEGLELIPAEASPDEVLALEPHRMEDAQEGPHPQIPTNIFVEWTKPDGDTFIAPLANVETYERKGFTRGADVQIDDLVAHWAETAETPPGPGPTPPEPEPEPAPPEPAPEPAP